LAADSRNSSPPLPNAEVKKQTSVAAIYTVVAGNTLSGISKKYKVSVDALKTENKLHGHMLRVGQKLKIPAVK
jgi:LysM repeat protein